MIKIKSEEEIRIMAQAGQILAKVMKDVVAKVKPGVDTKSLDRAAKALILSFGAKPSFENYNNFPASICASINEEVVHGVPSAKRKLKEGDILSIDMGVYYKGYHSDMAITVGVGQISPEASRLIRVTKKSLKRGIKKIRPGLTFGDIGNTIQRYAQSQGYSIIRELVGHGIGKELHEDPEIPNYGKRRAGEKIKEGMVFCLEPMLSLGDWRIKTGPDGYAFQSKDSSLSAHFEHTIAVTSKGVKILTIC